MKKFQMKSFVLSGAMFSAMFSMTAQLAVATPIKPDYVSVDRQPNRAVILLRGGDRGAVAQLVRVFDRAGLPAKQDIEGRRLLGRKLQGSVYYLNGARYSVDFIADRGSAQFSVTDEANGQLVWIRGDVAAELYDTMARAGVPHRNTRSGVVYATSLVQCDRNLGTATCTIHVQR